MARAACSVQLAATDAAILMDPDCCASPPLFSPVLESLPVRSKEAPSPPVKPPLSASSEVGLLLTSLIWFVVWESWSVVLLILEAYFSTTVPAATASASAISLLLAVAETSRPPVVLIFRLRRESTFSSATPTATDAPTAVSVAVTSPLANDVVVVTALVETVMLSVAVMVEPLPI